ncbi:site-specific DNA-methyltransferase [Acetobacter indonesiensis]|uniref:site-specific DNA-methyltransferase n=1 Tax=Acetobacter indonesiensis TaxID=104101 RepID=UPI001F1E2FD8|nr:site-specific DNA-methyltransferase [Acetobacter indonesiensis]MCG0996404.1 site-specific DNA-methyltransferase [Acetobacter indonesiensis]
MKSKQKLELTWVGKENRPRLEPRILIEDTEKSYHATARVSENDIFDNVLIHGDNLLALKALEADYAGKVKCVFIDPPYNTGSAFTHYDDGLEHSIWLGLMRDRLEIIRRLMSEDGSLWITIDDNEAHYLKVLCDEIFGRSNFMANVIWEKADSPRMDARFFSTRHDNMIVFAKNSEYLQINHIVEEGGDAPSHYNKLDEKGRRYYLKPLRAMGVDGTREARPSMYFALTAPDGSKVYPKNPDGSDSRWRWSPERVQQELWRIEWVKGRKGWSANFRIYADDNDTRPPETIWTHAFAGSNRHAKSEAKGYIDGIRPFDTPKPEKLLSRVIQIATNKGDIVLDSFAGSGTTGAVAHKMNRCWIMVELGEHCFTHIAPRLRKVIDGNDQGGISKAVDWKGGGGFRYYELAPSLLEKDKWGREVISKQYNAEMLAQALCKLEGFAYAPSPDVYWQQGHSSEADFLYVTTQTLGSKELTTLSEDVGEGRSLLILCAAFRGNTDLWPNLTVRKIPNHIHSRCEWGHDDYSLNVANLPQAEVPIAPVSRQGGLFDDGDVS